jgi:calcineurin-like phosphoesterase family protein
MGFRIKNAYVISDLHLGSDKLAQVRGFEDAWDFWRCYETAHRSVILDKNQPIIILGDIAMSIDWLKILVNQLPGRFHFVLGNHDILPMYAYLSATAKNGGKVHAMVMLPHQKAVLTHFPVHESFFGGNKTEWKNVHGHCHTQTIPGPYIGCAWEQSNTPRLLTDLIK